MLGTIHSLLLRIFEEIGKIATCPHLIVLVQIRQTISGLIFEGIIFLIGKFLFPLQELLQLYYLAIDSHIAIFALNDVNVRGSRETLVADAQKRYIGSGFKTAENIDFALAELALNDLAHVGNLIK